MLCHEHRISGFHIGKIFVRVIGLFKQAIWSALPSLEHTDVLIIGHRDMFPAFAHSAFRNQFANDARDRLAAQSDLCPDGLIGFPDDDNGVLLHDRTAVTGKEMADTVRALQIEEGLLITGGQQRFCEDETIFQNEVRIGHDVLVDIFYRKIPYDHGFHGDNAGNEPALQTKDFHEADGTVCGIDGEIAPKRPFGRVCRFGAAPRLDETDTADHITFPADDISGFEDMPFAFGFQFGGKEIDLTLRINVVDVHRAVKNIGHGAPPRGHSSFYLFFIIS